MPEAATHLRSKTLAAWLAVLGGTLGLHRMYLHGLADRWAWLQVPFTALGLIGVHRMLTLGQDDRTAWLLLPLLGLSIAAAMLAAIVIALTPDERWNERFNTAHAAVPPTSRWVRWPTAARSCSNGSWRTPAVLRTAAGSARRTRPRSARWPGW
jgi:hypothetical protein